MAVDGTVYLKAAVFVWSLGLCSCAKTVCKPALTSDNFTDGICCFGTRDCLCSNSENFNMEIKRPNGETLHCGSKTDDTDMAAAEFGALTVDYKDAQPGKTYTVMLLDPDKPPHGDISYAHWIKTNVPGNSLHGARLRDLFAGQNDVPFEAVVADNDEHRVQMYILEETGQPLKNIVHPNDRGTFWFRAFLTSNDLCGSLVSGHQFNVINNAPTAYRCDVGQEVCQPSCGAEVLCMWPGVVCGDEPGISYCQASIAPPVVYRGAKSASTYLLITIVAYDNTESAVWIADSIPGEGLKIGQNKGNVLLPYTMPDLEPTSSDGMIYTMLLEQSGGTPTGGLANLDAGELKQYITARCSAVRAGFATKVRKGPDTTTRRWCRDCPPKANIANHQRGTFIVWIGIIVFLWIQNINS